MAVDLITTRVPVPARTVATAHRSPRKRAYRPRDFLDPIRTSIEPGWQGLHWSKKGAINKNSNPQNTCQGQILGGGKHRAHQAELSQGTRDMIVNPRPPLTPYHKKIAAVGRVRVATTVSQRVRLLYAGCTRSPAHPPGPIKHRPTSAYD